MSRNINEDVFDSRLGGQPRIDYGSVNGRPGRRDRQVMRLLQRHGIDGCRCLDVGPGTGRWLQYLKDGGASELAAVDLSTEALARAAELGADCRKVDLDSEPLGFDTDTFDVVLSFMVLEHIKAPELFVDELVRVAKPSALVLLTVPNIASLQSRLRLLAGFLPVAVSQDPTHVRFYTPRELRALFARSNATVEVVPTSFSLHPFNRRRWRIPSVGLTAGLDDHRLFRVRSKR